MLVDVEGDELPYRLDTIERVQIQPLVLQDSPPGLDQRIGEGDICHRQESSERAGLDQIVDVRVEVLDTAVEKKGGWFLGLGDVTRGVQKHQESVPGIEALAYSPGKNPTGEVVDYRMNVRSSPVKEPNHTGVDMPKLIGHRRSNTDLWLFGMDSPARSSPLVSANESVPGRRGRKDLSETLGQNRKCSGRDVAVLIGSHHVFDDAQLIARQLVARRSWAGGDVVEVAARLTFPRMISRRRQADATERRFKRKGLARTFDCAGLPAAARVTAAILRPRQ